MRGRGQSKLVSTERIVNLLAPSVDFWGLNIYRGASFFSVFDQWRDITVPPYTSKPMFFSVFGTDAFRSQFHDVLTGGEDESIQADWIRSLWREIVGHLSALRLSDVCVGGTVFEWNDEWWKVRAESGGSPLTQETLGYGGPHPDGFANEEWFAIMAIDRRPRQAYRNLQADFAAIPPPPADLDGDNLPDSWEYRIVDAKVDDLLSEITLVRPVDDFDAHGFNNGNEYQVGSAMSTCNLGQQEVF